MIFDCGGDRRTVEVRGRGADGALRILVDGTPFEVQVAEEAPGRFRIEVGGRAFTLHGAVDGRTLHFSWQGRAYRLTRESGQAGRGPQSGEVEAPMPGRVVSLLVRPGEDVAEGQGLVVIEAMKMENVLRAPRTGRVRAVRAAVGERVEPGRILVEID